MGNIAKAMDIGILTKDELKECIRFTNHIKTLLSIDKKFEKKTPELTVV